MFRIIMAVSADGYVAREENDKMLWLGETDKSIFRILTGVGGVIGASVKTKALMPEKLEGRSFRVLSRGGPTLIDFYNYSTNKVDRAYWLIGGQILVMSALTYERENLVSEVHICRSNRFAFPADVAKATKDKITPFLEGHRKWHLAMITKVADVKVECWRSISIE